MEVFTLFTLLFVAGLAFVQWRQGLLAGVALLYNVTLAGVIAFNFWEPLARALGSASPRLDPYADALWLTVLFVVALLLLKVLTSRLLLRPVQFDSRVQQVGGGVAGLLTGYLLVGILMCILQTLPLPRQLLGADLERGTSFVRPDLVWLGLVHHSTGRVFDGRDAEWFDAEGSFIHRHARYRRIGSGQTGPVPNRGEFELPLNATKTELQGQK